MPLSMKFSRQEYWSGLPIPSPGDLPNWGIEHWSSALQADSLPSEPPGKSSRLSAYPYQLFVHCSVTKLWEKTFESPVDYKIKPVNPKENQSWIFIGRTDDEAEMPILWPPDAQNWLIGKDPDAGKDWRQEEKRTIENEVVGWHHWLDRLEFEQASEVGDEQGSLACCSPQGLKKSDTTEWTYHWTDQWTDWTLWPQEPQHVRLPCPSLSHEVCSNSYPLCQWRHPAIPSSVTPFSSCPYQLQFSSVAQSCPTLCDPMNRSTPGLPVHHQLPESTQTHVHRVGDAIQLSHPLSSPSPPALILSQNQHQSLFQWVNSLHEVAKVLEFQLQHQSFQWTPKTDLL